MYTFLKKYLEDKQRGHCEASADLVLLLLFLFIQLSMLIQKKKKQEETNKTCVAFFGMLNLSILSIYILVGRWNQVE